MDLLKRIRTWRRWKADLHASSIADVPDQIRRRHAVVVGSGARDKWLVFDCPCRRGHRVLINLDPENSPRWRVTARVPLTLIPSVDERSQAGHCHYVVRDGGVRWIERTDHR